MTLKEILAALIATGVTELTIAPQQHENGAVTASIKDGANTIAELRFDGDAIIVQSHVDFHQVTINA